MKKVLALFLMSLMLISAACAESTVELFTTDWGKTISSSGVYVTLTREEGALWCGPGYEYENMGGWRWDQQQVRCLCLVGDWQGNTWVLIDYCDRWGIPYRGYIPLYWCPENSYRPLNDLLPWENCYDALTPLMIAQLYTSCTGYWGPGTEYPAKLALDVSSCEGTLILRDGDWVLMELSPDSTACYECYGMVRVWIRESDCFY